MKKYVKPETEVLKFKVSKCMMVSGSDNRLWINSDDDDSIDDEEYQF